MSEPIERMTKGERTELGQLIRKRERVLKALAVERSTTLLSEFEDQCSAIYFFDQDGVWKEAFVAAEKIVEDSQKIIAARCEELGIPKEFAPSANLHWYNRGENAVKARRLELRQMAKAKIVKLEKQAIAQIERMSLEAQTEVIANGLQSKAALGFLERLPDISTLMPSLDAAKMKLIDTKS